MMGVYEKGFSEDNIIGEIDREVKDMLAEKMTMPGSVAFVNSTWIEHDSTLERIKNFDNVIVYSGPDWENTNCIPLRRNAHQFLEDNNRNVVHVGNTYGPNYFSYWLYFVYEHLDRFLPDNFDYTLNSNHKTYMCLNRKPHNHRIQLMEKLYENKLLDAGHTSLGTFDDWQNKSKFDKLPIVLDVDKEYTLGNEIAGDVGIPNDILSLGNNNLWCDHFLNVVTETVIHSDVFVSEKTYKPILGLRPFVILGDDRIYDVLHDYGIDTFDDIFGKWYTDKNYENRINSIVDIISSMESYGAEKRNKLFKSLESRLMDNRMKLIEQAQNFEVKLNV
tara:strand:- start:3266 stop:4264 length:999 start_codon:yes stop_codon:yes gene_type:complete